MSLPLPNLADLHRLATLGQRMLRNGDGANPRWHEMQQQADGTLSWPWPEYPAAMEEFVREASRDCWSDQYYDPNDSARMINDARFVATASLPQLRTMVTYFVRGEKFCDGHWAGMFRDGHVGRLIKRMRELLPTFEYCSLKYLDLWLSGECRWVEAMRGDDRAAKLQAMANFAKAYRISRNFHLKHELKDGVQAERFGEILNIIDPLTEADFAGDELLPKLSAIRKQISARYGGSDVLSGTTKFLWLKVQSPIIIFDGQARVALDTKYADIDGFYVRWRNSYEIHALEIAQACSNLDQVRRYCVDPAAVTPRFIDRVASQPWFHERVFDIYLWTLGGQPKLETSASPENGD